MHSNHELNGAHGRNQLIGRIEHPHPALILVIQFFQQFHNDTLLPPFAKSNHGGTEELGQAFTILVDIAGEALVIHVHAA